MPWPEIKSLTEPSRWSPIFFYTNKSIPYTVFYSLLFHLLSGEHSTLVERDGPCSFSQLYNTSQCGQIWLLNQSLVHCYLFPVFSCYYKVVLQYIATCINLFKYLLVCLWDRFLNFLGQRLLVCNSVSYYEISHQQCESTLIPHLADRVRCHAFGFMPNLVGEKLFLSAFWICMFLSQFEFLGSSLWDRD